jgi:lipopolysaccharide transport system ATP-binding protein
MSLSIQLENVSKVFKIGSSAGGELVSAMSAESPRDESTNYKAAIDQLSLCISEGDRLGIVGRNGAGKSTLLHMIAGIADPSSGTIHVNGKVTAIMTLGVGLRDDLSGRENIYVDGEIQGKSRKIVEEVIDEIIEFSELGKFIDYPVRTYSTGMKARLSFSMITHIEPEILIIDEALSVGDASFSVKASARIKEICDRGKIVILVSHGLGSIRNICNRCIYLKDGRIVMDGSPEEVTKAYVDEVHGQDEAALMQRFAAHVGKHSYRPGCEISNISLFNGNNQTDSLRLEALESMKIQVRGQVAESKSKYSCHLKIVRLDDLVMFNEELHLANYIDDIGEIGIEIKFESLVLGAAIYRLDATIQQFLENESEIVANSSVVFEVFNMKPPSGGKPMIHYPVSASAAMVNI